MPMVGMLSALWTAWRHHFSLLGVALAVIAFFGGMAFLTIYLLVVSYQLKGDIRALVMGAEREPRRDPALAA